MTVVINYEAGNIGSIKNMIKKIGYDAVISSDPQEVKNADHIILPGVGSFDYGITKLRELNLIDILNEKKRRGTPILGICLGAQLMCQKSEEGTLPGLGWINGVVKKFPVSTNGKRYTVPHMGWDTVTVTKNSRLFSEASDAPRFYFVHSYFIQCANPADVLTENHYSTLYHSAFERENIIGVQYHPEKSHHFGKHLLKNFLYNY